MKLKRTSADGYFSDCVRIRSNWTCERCGKEYGGRSQGLHCSHFVTRGNNSLRHDPGNAVAHCHGCHQTIDPWEFTTYIDLTFGEGMAAKLHRMRHDTNLGREAVRAVKDGTIAQHYKTEFQRMEKLRMEGATERLDFTGWNWEPEVWRKIL